MYYRLATRHGTYFSLFRFVLFVFRVRKIIRCIAIALVTTRRNGTAKRKKNSKNATAWSGPYSVVRSGTLLRINGVQCSSTLSYTTAHCSFFTQATHITRNTLRPIATHLMRHRHWAYAGPNCQPRHKRWAACPWMNV